MVPAILNPIKTSLEQSTKTEGATCQKLVFQIKKIVDCLDSIIDSLTKGKSSESQCLNLEEYCQELIDTSNNGVKKDREVDYQAILSLVFRTKVALSEIYFGDLVKSKLKLSKSNNQKLESKVQKKLLILKDNVKKLKIALDILAVS